MHFRTRPPSLITVDDFARSIPEGLRGDWMTVLRLQFGMDDRLPGVRPRPSTC